MLCWFYAPALASTRRGQQERVVIYWQAFSRGTFSGPSGSQQEFSNSKEMQNKFDCLIYASVISSSAHPPRADPRALGFLEDKRANAPRRGQTSCSNAPRNR